MSKTDKELAVDVAIAYINNIYCQNSTSAGIQQGKLSLEICNNIIKSVYNTLSELKDDK